MLPDTDLETKADLDRRSGGTEWLIDATGCDAARLSELTVIQGLFDALIAGMRLNPVEPAAWHQFPGHGGITGVCLLAESHLACHTFPEHESACLNVFCCKPREEPGWESLLRVHLRAGAVGVTRVTRNY
ncbi:MAG: S-adenosylmethionine decarboxylase [Acidobacteria bacterium]|nr:S-adenosylmethionine decarboxylase [Acidobacteriota bacterium]